jgi:uncharacterized protein YbaP (TraB family)
MGFALIAAGLATASVPAAPANWAPALPDADPAMWVVNDADTTIFLFGTFHALDGKSDWFNDEVRTAFDQSQELVLETLLPSKPPAPAPQFGFRNFSSPAIKTGASFLASTRLALSAGRSQGLRIDKGADAILRGEAEAMGKAVSGIESFEYQLSMFERIPPAAPPAPPKAGESVDPMDDMSRVLGTLQTAWNTGDGETFAAMLDGLRGNSPETYRVLFVERNASWAKWVANRLDQPGTVFVAVGAGHLAGPDSLQNKLAQLGVKSARIN